MNVDEMNDLLFRRLYDEQEKYRMWLMSQPSKVIVAHCYEYAMREDLLFALEYMWLDEAEVRALLSNHVTLESLYQDYECKETDHMEAIRDTIEDRAKSILRESKGRW